MDRKGFLRRGLLGLGVATLPGVITSCSKDKDDTSSEAETSLNGCVISPAETVGPFPILTPAQYVRASIIADRTGVALMIVLNIQDHSNGCTPLSGAFVDVWHCDKDGNYSQYGGNQLQSANYTSQNFLRGRQTTNANGQVSFISIFPGWYPGRAPHIHIDVRTTSGVSLLVTQIAFPVSVYSAVYATNSYNGAPDRSNTQDGIFADSLNRNMADNITGNVIDGYTLTKTITVG